MKDKKRVGETIFIIIYLLFLIISMILLIRKKNYYILLMTAFLGIGDSFHLIPRILSNIKENYKNKDFYLGIGTQISSITMTIFYLLLIYYLTKNNRISMNFFIEYIKESLSFKNILGGIITYLGIIRIILCLLPNNNWYKKEGNEKWAIIRNIPFTILGGIAIIIAFITSNIYLGILILLSFLFYLPVAIHGKKKKILGMLMIPKTICYMLMISYLI